MSKTNFSFDPASTALLVIDMQNDFCSEKGCCRHWEGYDVEPLRKIIILLAFLIEAARDSGIQLIFTKQVNRGPADQNRRISETRGEGTEIPLRKGTWGADIVEALRPRQSDYIVEKRRYSAFYNTDLEILLKNLNVETLIFTGVLTNVCVENTLRAAIDRDYRIIFVDDCTATVDPSLQEATLNNLRYMMDRVAFGKILGSKELIEIFKKANIPSE